ncbi:hypothetical protein NL108_018249 [Boleophthalmus pectinirostris]|uniref:zinc finger protein 16-like isoform X2 n=1 Tax=Boleophthalmus pectinirostris TaxID=150288 RepID=UPI00243082E1|nr:zinc finger protein 16-like isoform X2 [Boleophthalmus pectinirostris]XP_055013224.1 zinc finger protein 16-like isoform X2 [Boleophthalmus pectinirostris]KAJ0055425.1 hypothetical protein NL108_018249 [Boleophthalmus pectinirostris]
MCPVSARLREAVRRRLAAAAEEICDLLEETLSEYEEETQRQRRALEQLLRAHTDGDSPVGAPLLFSQQPESPPHLLKREHGGQGVTDQLCGEAKSGDQVSEEQEDVTDQLCGDVKTEEQVSEFSEAGVFLQSEQQEALSHGAWADESLDLGSDPQDAPASPGGGAGSPAGGGASGGGASPAGRSRRRARRVRECPLCGLRFQSTFNLETHLRVHTGERPFSCSVCGKTFNRKDSLNNHRKIHQGETFCCGVCGKRYSDKSNLRRHAITAHGNASAAHAHAHADMLANAGHTNANTHADTHGDIHADIHANMHGDMHADMHADMHTNMHADMHADVHAMSHAHAVTHSHAASETHPRTVHAHAVHTRR